jgi:hypothetical protein
MIVFLKHRFKKLKKSQKILYLFYIELNLDILIELVIELVVSFRQCKDVAGSKGYSVIIHLLTVVNVCCRL